jgi:hypothetical protein
MRHQAVNLVNQPMGFFLIYEFAKYVLSDKIKSRMNLYRSDKAMFKLMAPDAIPKEYGGTGASLVEMGMQWREKLLEARDNVVGLDRMMVEYEAAASKMSKKSSSWISLSRWFSRQKSVATTNEDVKAEWNSTRFKVPPGLPFWLQAVLALPGLPRIIQKFANEEQLVTEFEGYVETGNHVEHLFQAQKIVQQL